jgi:Holliday junction resolvase RusA-like endonuclease
MTMSYLCKAEFMFPISRQNQVVIGFTKKYPITRKDVDKIRKWLDICEDALAYNDDVVAEEINQ